LLVAVLAVLLVATAAGATSPPPLSDSGLPVTTRPPSPLEDVLDDTLRFAQSKDSAVAALAGYAEAQLVAYARPTLAEPVETVLSSTAGPRSSVLAAKPPDFGRLAAMATRERLVESILAALKRDVIQAQTAYDTSFLQGLTPLQWFLLSKEVPSTNTFSFHRALRFLEELFLEPPVAAVVGPLAKAFHSLDRAALLRGFYDYRVRRLDGASDTAAMAAALSYCETTCRRYHQFHGQSYTRIAQFFAVLHDTVATAAATSPAAGVHQLGAVFADLRLLNLRLAGVVTGPAKPVPPGRTADDIELAVRETLIYGIRLVQDGLHVPSAAAARATELLSGDECVRRLEDLQRSLLQIRGLQRRALRAVSEHRRIRDERPDLAATPAWMYADVREHCAELEKEVRVSVYGGEPGFPKSESVEGLLFCPTLKAEVLSLHEAFPAVLQADAGAISARNEVYRLLERIKLDHELTILPFLHEIDLADAPEPGAPPRTVHVPTTAEALPRLAAVRAMVDGGHDGEGALLTPRQLAGLRNELARLAECAGLAPVPSATATTATTGATGAAPAPAPRPGPSN